METTLKLCWARPLDSLPHTMSDIIRKFQVFMRYTLLCLKKTTYNLIPVSNSNYILMFCNLTQPECNKTSASYQVLPKQMCDLWKLASADVISHIFLCQLAKRNQISKYCFFIGCHSNMNWFVTHWHTKTEWHLNLVLLYKFSLFIEDLLFTDWCKKTWHLSTH